MLPTLFNLNPLDPPDGGSGSDERVEFVRYYHAATKHHFHRFARSLGYLDWASQPDPFRRFAGAPLIPLPFLTSTDSPAYHALYEAPALPAQPVTIASVAQLFELSLGLSAWKEYGGTRWALRINPSSGNLHPTEGYLVLGPAPGTNEIPGLGADPLICHYAPAEHALETRAQFAPELWQSLMAAFPAGSFLVGLTSIHWREAWKYGERAFRYCQHDTGHALAALRLAAALLGWRLVILEELADSEIAQLLGLDRASDFTGAEREHPDLIAVVIPAPAAVLTELALPSAIISEISQIAIWQGQANALSRDHMDWPIIDEVAEACDKPRTESQPASLATINQTETALASDAAVQSSATEISSPSALQIIRQRRSAVALDGQTEIRAKDFYRMLLRTMPAQTEAGTRLPPWDAVPWPAAVHLCLFVHRIHELLPGLYVLARDAAQVANLKAAMRPDFMWARPPDCRADLPLYFLREGNCQVLASQVSCTQDIAGDGAFSLGMVAAFYPSLRQYGAWYYRRLFWETGMIGQMLYLEAEASGIRGTGIGCFFDDPVHEVFGFSDWQYQSLYHFTMGGPVEDRRLTTWPPYSEAMMRARSLIKLDKKEGGA